MPIFDMIFAGVWIAFGIYWVVAAVGARGPHLWSARSAGIRVIVALLVILAERAHILTGHAGAVDIPWLRPLGLVLFLLGVSLACWARLYLGNNWGMPMSQKVDPELITNGPYRYVRHPIYSGLILAGIGTAVALDIYALVVVALAGGYFVYSATVEERNMAARFPTAYPPYRSSTKMLVPFLV